MCLICQLTIIHYIPETQSNISSSSCTQPRTTTTPGPSSVSSSGYPPSPGIITLDSPSPPQSPQATVQQTQNPNPSCMMSVPTTQANYSANGNIPNQGTFGMAPTTMPFLDMENEASSVNINYPQSY